MWVKNKGSDSLNPKIKRLIKIYGFKGYGILKFLKEILISLEKGIPYNNTLSDLEDLALILDLEDLDELRKLIEYGLKINLFKIKDNFLIDDELEEALEKLKNRKVQAKEAAAKRWAKTSQDISNFDMKKQLEDYEGDFASNSLKEENQLQKVKIHNTEFKKDKDDFFEFSQEFLGIIPEPSFLPNKQEKEALKRVYNMIDEGLFRKFKDGYIKGTLKTISSKHPNFYISEFYNHVISDLREKKNADGNVADQWIITALKKYTNLS